MVEKTNIRPKLNDLKIGDVLHVGTEEKKYSKLLNLVRTLIFSTREGTSGNTAVCDGKEHLWVCREV